MLAFKLGGSAEVPPGLAPLGPVPRPTYAVESTAPERRLGMELFHFHCSVCHGPQAVAGGAAPDLRHLGEAQHRLFDAIVRGGQRQHGGMPAFADLLDAGDVRAIQAYLLERAAESAGGL